MDNGFSAEHIKETGSRTISNLVDSCLGESVQLIVLVYFTHVHVLYNSFPF